MQGFVTAENSACPCGQARFAVQGKLLARIICHCSICQSLYKAPFADVTAFWAGSTKLRTPDEVQFKRYRPPPALQRGTCRSCGAPVVGYLQLAPLIRLAFVPTINLKPSVELPEPAMHIFYHRRVREVHDEVPKVSGYWRSELAVTRLVLSGTAQRKR